MFAVPGWSLSPSQLKTEKAPLSDAAEKKASKKRKRGQDVDASNVADLWEKHLGGGGRGQETGAELNSGRRSISPPKENANASHDAESSVRKQKKHKRQEEHAKQQDAKKSQRDKQPTNAAKQADDDETKQKAGLHAAKKDRASQSDKKPKQAQQDANTIGSGVKLTPLQSAMQKKLSGARFRYLNESLYTSPSSEAMKMFASNPNFFDEYHSGFRQQVESWPENPVDVFVAELRDRGLFNPRFKHSNEETQQKKPLPRTKGAARIADLGCGDAKLAKSVEQFSRKANVQVQSFDLHGTDPHVTKADIADLPLPADSVNVAIFCLALMGTNWVDFIDEAWRILHWKGELWVAEIKSRFARPRNSVVEHSVGKKRVPSKSEEKKQRQAEEAEASRRTIAEMDGPEDKDHGTDVSAFVKVLRRRGFALENEYAVDLSNKMFVRMRFLKALPPLKGKNYDPNAQQAGKKNAWRDALREDETDEQEARVLKPCLYKTR